MKKREKKEPSYVSPAVPYILLCPFCGSRAKFFDDMHIGGSFVCEGCGASTAYFEGKAKKSALELAAEAWNRRTRRGRKRSGSDRRKSLRKSPV